MNITRNNYEEFFMLYEDNELSAAQRKEVEAFIAANADLQHELALVQQYKLSPDEAVVFENKASLLQQDASQLNISTANCDAVFVLYADDELSNDEKAGVEDFVYRHPQMQETFELLQQVKLSPDTSIAFENKESLYRKEKDDKVIPFPWRRLAAAAAAIILFVSGLFWLNKEKGNVQIDIAKGAQNVQPVKNPSLQIIKDTVTEKNNKNKQPATTTIAVTNTKKENEPVKSNPSSNVIAATGTRKEIKHTISNLSIVPGVIQKEDVAGNNGNKFTSSTISPIAEQPAKVEIKRPLIAAAKEAIIDQPAIILNPDADNKTKVSYASLTNDNVEVLNTSVNTKNSLRGFLRKATRIIAKKTNAGNEDGKHKSILIGGFEIAVR
jgi:hypothetical protein